MFSNYMTGLEMNEYGMSNLEINKYTLALQIHRLFHFPQQLVMKKIGLNTANIEIKEAKCLWS